MKKLLCLAICLMMILSSVQALAATKEFGAYNDAIATNIYLEGKAELEGKAVTVLFYNETTDTYGYVAEIPTQKDGTYSSKFKFMGDISGYTLAIRDSETATDITNTLTTAIAQKDVYSVDIDLNVSGNDVIKYASEGDILNIVADIENKYADSKKATVMLAAYDENNVLLATDIKTLEIGFGDVETKKTVEFDDVTFPANAVKAKAFAWQDTVNLIPLDKEQTMLAYGDTRLFENENADPDDTWVVGFTGASTVQAGYYQHFIEQYYATRHSDKNVVFINKGCPGYTAKDIYLRLDWDIFNENDPLGYGACDEIVIMVGANDLQYTKYTHGEMDDDEYEEYYDGTKKNGVKTANMRELVNDSFYWYTQVIEECKKRGKSVAFTPMTVYDESQDFVHDLYDVGTVYGFNHALGMLSDKLEEYAREQEEAGFPITFLDTWGMSDEYTDMIRANEDPAVKNYIKNNNGYVLLGDDGLHHSSAGGYVVGYIIARGLETDPVVASVEIDAAANNVVAVEDADVTLSSATSNYVEYTYAPKALPMYSKAPGYVHGENLGIDITGTINNEIIKVSGLEDGTYSITMTDKNSGTAYAVGNFDASALGNGVNIATLTNNPGQVQAKDIYSFNKEASNKTGDLDDVGKRLNEVHIRQIATTELAIRKANTSQFGVDHNDPIYDTMTVDEWCELAKKVGSSDDTIKTYRTRKENQSLFIENVRANVEGTRARMNPGEYTVVITKVQ